MREVMIAFLAMLISVAGCLVRLLMVGMFVVGLLYLIHLVR